MDGKRGAGVYAAFALVCVIFGTTFLGIKIGVEAGAPPFLFAGMRFVAAGFALALVLVAAGRATLRSLASVAPRAAALSSLYIVVNFGASFWAERTIDSGTAAQINSVVPVASAALSALFLGKRLTRAHFAGLAAGFVGVMLIVRSSAAADGPSSAAMDSPSTLVASIVMLAAALGFAGAQVLYKALFDERDDPLQVSAMNMAIGGVGLFALSAAFERRPFPASPDAWGALAYLIVVGSIVGHSVNLWLVKKAGPVFSSSWSYVSPVIATAAGFAVLGERAGPWAIAGTALTLAGVALIGRAEAGARLSVRREAAPSPPEARTGVARARGRDVGAPASQSAGASGAPSDSHTPGARALSAPGSPR